MSAGSSDLLEGFVVGVTKSHGCFVSCLDVLGNCLASLNDHSLLINGRLIFYGKSVDCIFMFFCIT